MKWGGSVAAAVLIVVWVASVFRSIAVGVSSTTLDMAADVSAAKHYLFFCASADLQVAPWSWEPGWYCHVHPHQPGYRYPVFGWFNWDSQSGKDVLLAVPLWFPVVLSLVASGWAWRLELHDRRRGHRCPSCGYDLAGLAPSGSCPECGKMPR